MDTEEHKKEKELITDNELKYELKLYEECCRSYHRVDDFRAKLLGFLPLVTGAGIFVTLSKKIGGNLKPFMPHIGIFGFIVTLGLLVFELKGIHKCTQFIYVGKTIEKEKFKTEGQFVELWEKGSSYINEPVAAGLIYSVVLTAWLFIFLYSLRILCSSIPVWHICGAVFFLSFLSVYKYWKKISKGFGNELE